MFGQQIAVDVTMGQDEQYIQGKGKHIKSKSVCEKAAMGKHGLVHGAKLTAKKLLKDSILMPIVCLYNLHQNWDYEWVSLVSLKGAAAAAITNFKAFFEAPLEGLSPAFSLRTPSKSKIFQGLTQGLPALRKKMMPQTGRQGLALASWLETEELGREFLRKKYDVEVDQALPMLLIVPLAFICAAINSLICMRSAL